jgi:hypothetical protein
MDGGERRDRAEWVRCADLGSGLAWELGASETGSSLVVWNGMVCDGRGRTKRGVLLQCYVKVRNKAGGEEGVFNRLRAASEVPRGGFFSSRLQFNVSVSSLVCILLSLRVS